MQGRQARLFSDSASGDEDSRMDYICAVVKDILCDLAATTGSCDLDKVLVICHEKGILEEALKYGFDLPQYFSDFPVILESFRENAQINQKIAEFYQTEAKAYTEMARMLSEHMEKMEVSEAPRPPGS